MRIKLLAVAALLFSLHSSAQTEVYERKNTYTFFTEYSNNSSHILMGRAEDRKHWAIGGAYERRLLHPRGFRFSYVGEFRPVVLVSDPVQKLHYVITVTDASGTHTDVTDPSLVIPRHCEAGSDSFSYSTPTESVQYSVTATCGRQWGFGQEFTPAGLRANFRTSKPLQPFVTGNAGFMFTTHPEPIQTAGSFNFTFGAGVGVEWFQSHTRSWSAEVRYRHYSNKNSASSNPGVDQAIVKVGYSFGR